MNHKRTFFLEDNIQVNFSEGTLLKRKRTNRAYTHCIMTTPKDEFFSGVAVLHPKEEANTKTGWKISLQRACQAVTDGTLIPDGKHQLYKHLWSQIRQQWWFTEMEKSNPLSKKNTKKEE